MSAFTAAGCRIRQSFIRAGRRMRPVREQVFEDGRGALYSIAPMMRAHGLQKPLLVCDAFAAPWDVSLRQILEEGDIPYAAWDARDRRATEDNAQALSKALADAGCDSFIALGRPEIIELAKLAALAAGRHAGREAAPVIAVPTAAGSGAEALCWAYHVDGDGMRRRMEAPALRPAFAVYDPSLTADTPRDVLAACVTEGLCLAVEAYLSGYADEAARSAAASAVRGFFEAAEPCWNSGGTLLQRGRLLEASRLAGEAASAAGAGYARAICDAAVAAGLPFESVCASVLPAVLEKYGKAAAPALSALARQAGVAADNPQTGDAAALIDRIRSLAFRMGLPETLDSMQPDAAEEAAARAAADANPRWASPAVWGAEDCARVLKTVIETRKDRI